MIAPSNIAPSLRLMREIVSPIDTTGVSQILRAALRYSLSDVDGVKMGWITMNRPARAGNA